MAADALNAFSRAHPAGSGRALPKCAEARGGIASGAGNPRFVTPEFPHVKVARKQSARMSLEDQVAVILSIPEPDRGIFHLMAYTIRPGEARAAVMRHYDWKTGTLWIGEALKGKSPHAKRGPTKTGEAAYYRLGDELRGWIESNTPTERRFQKDSPLFPNPRTGHAYRMGVLQKLWRLACKAAEVEYVPLYRALKHSTVTALLEAGASLEEVRALCRHRNPSSTAVYDLEDVQRRLAAQGRVDEAKVSNLSPRTSGEGADGD